jgi:catechol 2,3-dioxygenase-like lactoylglutathione lyase family enzyme
MTLDLFAGIAVRDHDAAVTWYAALLGTPPTFAAHATESVWVLADHRAIYVLESPGRAGHSLLTLMVPDLDAFLTGAAGRGLEPDEVEDYEQGVRKAVFHDPDGNEVGVGHVPT